MAKIKRVLVLSVTKPVVACNGLWQVKAVYPVKLGQFIKRVHVTLFTPEMPELHTWIDAKIL